MVPPQIQICNAFKKFRILRCSIVILQGRYNCKSILMSKIWIKVFEKSWGVNSGLASDFTKEESLDFLIWSNKQNWKIELSVPNQVEIIYYIYTLDTIKLWEIIAWNFQIYIQNLVRAYLQEFPLPANKILGKKTWTRFWVEMWYVLVGVFLETKHQNGT